MKVYRYMINKKLLNTVFPHIVSAETIFFEFGNFRVTVYKCADAIQWRKLFKGGNYMRKYGIQDYIKIVNLQQFYYVHALMIEI